MLTLISRGVTNRRANPRNAARKTAMSALRRDWTDTAWANFLQDGVEGNTVCGGS